MGEEVLKILAHLTSFLHLENLYTNNRFAMLSSLYELQNEFDQSVSFEQIVKKAEQDYGNSLAKSTFDVLRRDINNLDIHNNYIDRNLVKSGTNKSHIYSFTDTFVNVLQKYPKCDITRLPDGTIEGYFDGKFEDDQDSKFIEVSHQIDVNRITYNQLHSVQTADIVANQWENTWSQSEKVIYIINRLFGDQLDDDYNEINRVNLSMLFQELNILDTENVEALHQEISKKAAIGIETDSSIYHSKVLINWLTVLKNNKHAGLINEVVPLLDTIMHRLEYEAQPSDLFEFLLVYFHTLMELDQEAGWKHFKANIGGEIMGSIKQIEEYLEFYSSSAKSMSEDELISYLTKFNQKADLLSRTMNSLGLSLANIYLENQISVYWKKSLKCALFFGRNNDKLYNEFLEGFLESIIRLPSDKKFEDLVTIVEDLVDLDMEIFDNDPEMLTIIDITVNKMKILYNNFTGKQFSIYKIDQHDGNRYGHFLSEFVKINYLILHQYRDDENLATNKYYQRMDELLFGALPSNENKQQKQVYITRDKFYLDAIDMIDLTSDTPLLARIKQEFDKFSPSAFKLQCITTWVVAAGLINYGNIDEHLQSVLDLMNDEVMWKSDNKQSNMAVILKPKVVGDLFAAITLAILRGKSLSRNTINRMFTTVDKLMETKDDYSSINSLSGVFEPGNINQYLFQGLMHGNMANSRMKREVIMQMAMNTRKYNSFSNIQPFNEYIV